MLLFAALAVRRGGGHLTPDIRLDGFGLKPKNTPNLVSVFDKQMLMMPTLSLIYAVI